MTNMDNENGRKTDWEAVYDALMPRLYNFFRYRVGDNVVAQDLTSSTLMRVWRSRDSYRADLGAFEAWVFTIARNVSVDYLRKKRATVSIDTLYHLATQTSVEGEVQKRHDFEQLYVRLRTLATHEQELIALKYGAGMTNRAIAEATGLTESNVGTTLHRIIKRLRAEWELHYG